MSKTTLSANISHLNCPHPQCSHHDPQSNDDARFRRFSEIVVTNVTIVIPIVLIIIIIINVIMLIIILTIPILKIIIMHTAQVLLTVSGSDPGTASDNFQL